MSRSIHSIACALVLLALASVVSAQTFSNLTEDVGRGFGDNMNRYAWSMTSFGGNTYVGTWNCQLDYCGIAKGIISGQIDLGGIINGNGDGSILDFTALMKSEGGEIWRHDGGQNWTRVYDAPPADQGFRKMVVHDGAVYASSANYQTGATLLTSTNGTTWNSLSGGPLANPENASVRTMLSHNGLLYVGTENSEGAELWSYDTNTTTWTKRQTFADDTAVAELAIFGGKMYVGTWDFEDSYQLHCSDDTDNWNEVTPEFAGSDQLNNVGVMQLRDFKGKFYLGTVNYVDGFTLLRSDTPDDENSWQVITTNGLGDPDNAYTWASEEFLGKMYIGTFNHGLAGGQYAPLPIPLDGRAKLLASADGETWETVVDDGFGSKFTYGIRSMIIDADGRLVCGTASSFFMVDLCAELQKQGMGQEQIYGMLIEGMGKDEADSIMAKLCEADCGNWIGCEVYASDQFIPEPATMTLLLGCGLPLVLRRRRRKLASC